MTSPTPETRSKKPGRPVDPALTARRREEILAAAARIFARRGFTNTDLQVVADELGVGKGTIYRYFPAKRDLFLAAVEHALARLDNEIVAAVARETDPLLCMLAAFRTSVRYFERNPDVVQLLVQECTETGRKRSTFFERGDATIAAWEPIFNEQIAAGRLRKIDARRVTESIAEVVFGMAFASRFAGRRKAQDSRADDMLDMILHGILSDRERARRAGRRR
jgi:AcrR family transcriptional regulator